MLALAADLRNECCSARDLCFYGVGTATVYCIAEQRFDKQPPGVASPLRSAIQLGLGWHAALLPPVHRATTLPGGAKRAVRTVPPAG